MKNIKNILPTFYMSTNYLKFGLVVEGKVAKESSSMLPHKRI
jgi:hypothetical protein